MTTDFDWCRSQEKQTTISGPVHTETFPCVFVLFTVLNWESRTTSSLLETIQKRRKMFPCHGNVFLRFLYCLLFSRGSRTTSSLLETIQKRRKTFQILVHGALDYVHTVSFSLGFYIVLRPQGIRKQMKTLRKWHRVHLRQGNNHA